MDNHYNINLQQLRELIIRYGAKCMCSYESDLYYDCMAVEKLNKGDSVYWMVSEMHSHLCSAEEIVKRDLNVETIWGNRCNFKITCTKIGPYDTLFDMVRELTDGNLRKLVGRER